MTNKPIRVLHVFKIMNRGGAETMIMNIYRNIDRKKVQFDFLCTSNEKGAYDDEIIKLGGKIILVNLPSSKNIFGNINCIRKSITENGPYDVVHIPMMFYSAVVCVSARISGVKKVIVHSHSASEGNKNTTSRKIYRGICRFIINNFSTFRLACGSEARKFLFGNSDKAKNNTIIINNGIDIDAFSEVNKITIEKFKEDISINSNQIIIGNVARFVNVKNHVFFIKIAGEMKRRNIDFKILLVGDGELRSVIEEKVREEKLEEYFIFTGIREDIPIIMNSLDVFVMPSFYEGFPVSIIESISAGIPCVLSNRISKEVAIVKEMVTFLSLDDNIEKWVDNILKYINMKIDKKLYIDILKSNGYDVKYTCNILESLYTK